ncbi:hypothetical protein AJ85_10480 [Alkalihalobacillus alcalophilus ATCC 27647 = CGMCC 1.3604]|uniref:Zinc-finger domain-containing protein n=1 Tax=Alkalihalobacillus alcalophilus ATCC 27647 = CGMCC 1.3604 TaxID=1218173 RepID=A0A094YQU3_ALKAL|nr:hypothetical protein [Alkalihalobacillus alcalophilus]KGA95817.1 hypothetical protein BALCAV_0220115 [Alkalihalobacillus alcalophilus ATCC 27647 = CGMCC 1.3604]MED1563689.1 hypothetical protein [Alkalihalobacillus alcalophilus]THG90488.1 hypothetical protein AJ85_10480 [Alkalihalobacillus alcalophilus ATCC 27647 = CGMCC 1.3604]
MSHNRFTEEDWILYINGEVTIAMEETMEEHLYTCDECLGVYMVALEKIDVATSEPAVFVDVVMEKVEPLAKAEQRLHMKDIRVESRSQMNELLELPEVANGENQPIHRKPSKAKPKKKQTLLHYVLAASLTFILMTSGIFEEIAFGSDHLESIHEEESPRSDEETPLPVSERVLDKITLVFDKMTNAERGGHHE